MEFRRGKTSFYKTFGVMAESGFFDLFFYGEKSYVEAWLSLSAEEFTEIKKLIRENKEVFDALHDLHHFLKNHSELNQIRTYVEGHNLAVLLKNNLLTESEKLGIAGLLNTPPEAKTNIKTKSGWVYLMKDEFTGKIKIGFSVNPRFRENTLQSQNPSITIIQAWRGSLNEERELHKTFSAKRVRGEWFDLTGADIEKIQKFFTGREAWNK